MSVKVNGLNDAIGAIKSLSKIWDKQLGASIGKQARKIIVDRTRHGKDAHGKSFTPYSKKYKKSGTVNLTKSGYMLDSITVEPHDDYVRVYIPGTEGDKNFDIALVHNEGGKSGRGKGFRMPKREYFGIFTDDEIRQVKKIIEAKYDEVIRRLNK